jgi:hypothetical protein
LVILFRTGAIAVEEAVSLALASEDVAVIAGS